MNTTQINPNNYLTQSSELMRKFIAKQSEFIIKSNDKGNNKSRSKINRVKISELLSHSK